nr:ATP synthase F0 subunit 8 [Idiacanthus fasciola]
MPQLDPAPWFFILVLSWSIFLIIIPPKVLAHIYPNEPTIKLEQTKTKIWNWPWH